MLFFKRILQIIKDTIGCYRIYFADHQENVNLKSKPCPMGTVQENKTNFTK